MVDGRRQDPIDKVKIRVTVTYWHSMSRIGRTGSRPTNRPAQHPLFKEYEKGIHVPRDHPGGVIDQMDEVVPGTAALFRSLVWAILKGVPLRASVLRERLGLDAFDVMQVSPTASTFADLEALLMWVELAKAEGRHDAFASAVAGVETVMPQVRFIIELTQEADAFSAFLTDRLRVWQADVEERRVRGLLSPPAYAQAGLDPANRQNGGHLVAQLSSQWKHAAAGLMFLAISALTPDHFSRIAAMMMCATFTVCAYSAAASGPNR